QEGAEAVMQALLHALRRLTRVRSAARLVAPRRIAIIGLGLMGGSLAAALKRAQPAHALAGVDEAGRLERPRGSGLFTTLHEPSGGAAAVADAELVFLCAPWRTNLKLLPQIARDAGRSAVITDVGGLKREVCESAATVFAGPDAPLFVGGHPMAGKARGGFENASADLFEERAWVLTPSRDTPIEPLRLLKQVIESTGAIVQLLRPEEHDAAAVAVSHLPQLAAVALMLCAGGRDRGMAGPGLLDMTRLAASPAAQWNDLLGARSPEVIAEIQRLRAYLSEFEIALSLREGLDKWFDRANALRRELEGRG
ncbi:MAG: prephenate dehydrogenase/arogenate dehydrogenase family protein, partial [Planctomycetes bacterium]|nr:prephenate dehydrogenase/arogenate dehydrogenase family protein [Planctomycetota bacterium]